MGQYEPNDSRDVTLNQGHEPLGLERTGPREGETRQQEQSEDAHAQRGYGNARNEDGTMEQDVATGDLGNQRLAQGSDNAQPGEISGQPDERARADADRPLGES